MSTMRSLAKRVHHYVRAIERGAKRSSTILGQTARRTISRDTTAADRWRKHRNFGDELLPASPTELRRTR
jgi:hypothetical protein